MATVNIQINNTSWTEVVPSAGKGLWSNNAGIAFVRQDASAPAASENTGHLVEKGDSLNVDLSAGTDKLYARIKAKAPVDFGDSSFAAS
jgi:hypothetical protein